MTHDPIIPLCRAEFLQDISIELGRRFADHHPFRSFAVEVDTCEHNGEYKLGFYPQCDGFTPHRVAEASRDTVSVSTRLCYGESPLPTLRQIWKHASKVQRTGALIITRKAQPKDSDSHA